MAFVGRFNMLSEATQLRVRIAIASEFVDRIFDFMQDRDEEAIRASLHSAQQSMTLSAQGIETLVFLPDEWDDETAINVIIRAEVEETYPDFKR